MRRIFKYKLEEADEQTIQMPKGYQILGMLNQKDTPMLYALVDPDAEKEDVEIFAYGTGHEFDESKEQKFIGTVALYNEEFVLHFFEVISKKDDKPIDVIDTDVAAITTSTLQALRDTEEDL